MKKPSNIIILAVILLFAIIIFMFEKSLLQNKAANVAIGGNFTLTNDAGEQVELNRLPGKLRLIYFGFTFCPDTCPTSLQLITNILDQMGEKAKQIVPIFITVDPERDTPLQLKHYMQSFDPRIIALTGSASEIKKVAGQYKVYYAKGDEKPHYLINHSSFIYLVDAKGHYLTHFSYSDNNSSDNNPSEKVANIIAKIKEYL